DSGIYSPYEMKGKRLSFQKGLDDVLLLGILKGAKLTENDYNYVALDFTNEAFIKGEVDVMSAYLSDQPFSMQEQNIEVNIINPLNYGVDFYGDNLFTTDSEIQKYPQRVESFKRASLKGWHYALENIDETIEVIQAKYHSKRTKEHLEYEAKVIEEMILPKILDIGYTSIDRFYRIGEIYQSIGEISKEELEEGLEGLIYSAEESDTWLHYFYPMIGLVILFFLSSITLFFKSKRLKNMVRRKSRKLDEKEAMIDRYVMISETDLNGEIKNRKKDGSSYWIESYVSPVYDSKNKHTGYRSISQNITDKKRNEELSISSITMSMDIKRATMHSFVLQKA
ncbi:MAG: ABC transporter substrate-binding protein, partial [Campylobacterota bacterium]|nr:ABC transporter substrate-binding protein [Campylobacterota bacterium]